MRTRRVRLRVANVPWMEAYHGREASLIGQVIDALEVVTDDAMAYVDDRDGEASELAEAVMGAEEAFRISPTSRVMDTRRRFRAEFEAHCKRRFLHGEVQGVRREAVA